MTTRGHRGVVSIKLLVAVWLFTGCSQGAAPTDAEPHNLVESPGSVDVAAVASVVVGDGDRYLSGRALARIPTRSWDLVTFDMADPAQACLSLVKESFPDATVCAGELDDVMVVQDAAGCLSVVAFGPGDAVRAEFHLDSGEVKVSTAAAGVGFGSWCTTDSGVLSLVRFFDEDGNLLVEFTA